MDKCCYSTLEIVGNSTVFTVYLNRPRHSNALSPEFFDEFPKALSSLDQNPNVSVIILSGKGKNFCAGIDLKALSSFTSSIQQQQQQQQQDRGRLGEKTRRDIKHMQDAITAIEKCRKPVIAAVHGACVGGGVDIISACDMRYCTEDAMFSVKEVELAITADLGSLQRLPGIVGYANAMELALTARTFSGSQAKALGLVSQAFASKQDLYQGVMSIAQGIAAKSPLAVIGTKTVLLQSRDMSVNQGLEFVATWNSAMMLSDDLKEVASAQLQSRKPSFSKL